MVLPLGAYRSFVNSNLGKSSTWCHTLYDEMKDVENQCLQHQVELLQQSGLNPDFDLE